MPFSSWSVPTWRRHAALRQGVDGCFDVVDRKVEDRVGGRHEAGLRVDERVATAGEVQREEVASLGCPQAGVPS